MRPDAVIRPFTACRVHKSRTAIRSAWARGARSAGRRAGRSGWPAPRSVRLPALVDARLCAKAPAQGTVALGIMPFVRGHRGYAGHDGEAPRGVSCRACPCRSDWGQSGRLAVGSTQPRVVVRGSGELPVQQVGGNREGGPDVWWCARAAAGPPGRARLGRASAARSGRVLPGCPWP